MPNFPTLLSSRWLKKLLSFLLQFILFIALMILLVIGISLLLELTPLSDTTTVIGKLIYEWSMPLIASLSSIYLLDRWQKKRGLSFYGFSKSNIGKSLWVGFWVSTAILISSFLILWLGGWASFTNFDFQWKLFSAWLLFFLIQPLTEEIIMRSFLQTQLQDHFGKYAGLFITAAAFALIHGGNDHISYLALLQIFSGGLLIGLLFLYTQNIWASFAMHAGWNFLQSVVLGFSVSGMETYRIIETTTTGTDWWTGGKFGLEGSIITLVLVVLFCIYFWKKELSKPIVSI